MTTTLGVLLLIAVGVIGLAIEDHKQKVARIAELEARLTPWNKGKSGYKQPRKVKQYTEYKGISEIANQGNAGAL
jgi:hypothetical protein